MKRIFLKLLLLAPLAGMLVFGCGKVEPQGEGEGQGTEIPQEPDEPQPKPEKPAEKPKVVWIDAHANISRFKNKSNISYFLKKIKAAGLNTVVVDVKPVQGEVLYDSDFMTKCKNLGGTDTDFSWDYLQTFIDEAHKLGMKVTVSTTFFPMGSPSRKEGPVYYDKKWEGKTCLQYKKEGMVDIKNDPTKVAAFLNPVLPEVQDYLLRMVEEIVTKYDVDGYALDYCRFCDGDSDFSEASKEAFEKYLGLPVQNFPQDIFTYNSDGSRKPGKYYKQWWAFRAQVISDFVGKVRDRIKSVNPEISLEYWAGSWWHAIYGNGQNWASPDSNPYDIPYTSDWISPEYVKAGFAAKLDVFQLGAYLSTVYGKNNNESIEFAIARGKMLINGDCKMYGTYSCDSPDFDVEGATELCLKETDGIMIFDLVYIIKNNMWDKIKSGIDKAEKSLGIQ